MKPADASTSKNIQRTVKLYTNVMQPVGMNSSSLGPGPSASLLVGELNGTLAINSVMSKGHKFVSILTGSLATHLHLPWSKATGPIRWPLRWNSHENVLEVAFVPAPP